MLSYLGQLLKHNAQRILSQIVADALENVKDLRVENKKNIKEYYSEAWCLVSPAVCPKFPWLSVLSSRLGRPVVWSTVTCF